MPDRYVDPSVSASGTGGSWAQAYKTLLEATTAAAAGETIYFHNGTADVITADTTYACADGVRVISTSDKTNNPPTTYATGATVSTTTTGADVTINGVTHWLGITITLGDGTDANIINIAQSADDFVTMTNCSLALGGSSTSSEIGLGGATIRSAEIEFYNCSFSWAGTGQGFRVQTPVKFVGCDMSAGGTHPSVLFENVVFHGVVTAIGCDFSDIATIFESTPGNVVVGTLTQCSLKASSTVYSPAGYGEGEVFVFDCDDGDSHIEIGHYSYLGSTVISTSIYANDNIGDSNLSWVVAGAATATAVTPYYSPWMSVYHTGTAAITPFLECVRSGDATAYTEAQVWTEMTAKATAGSTRATLYSNRTAPLATPANNEASSKSASDWTGENATSWFGKLQLNAAITPAEAGHINARVGVAGELTVYIDPQIRGLS